MAEKVRPSFDQFIAKKGEPAALKSATEKYQAAVKKLAATSTSDAGYSTVREAKRAAAHAMHEARQKAEEEYYGEEVEENKKVIAEMKAENAKGSRAVAKS